LGGTVDLEGFYKGDALFGSIGKVVDYQVGASLPCTFCFGFEVDSKEVLAVVGEFESGDIVDGFDVASLGIQEGKSISGAIIFEGRIFGFGGRRSYRKGEEVSIGGGGCIASTLYDEFLFAIDRSNFGMSISSIWARFISHP
jgi:hypothetical protein